MVAGTLTGFVVTPFDVVTRRVQKGDFATPRSAVVSLVRHEGASSLFRGLAPTLIMFASTNAMYFPVYEQLRTELNRRFPSFSLTPVFAGSIARAFVACLSSPLEYVRTNMQSNSAMSQSGGGGVLVVSRRIWSAGTGQLFSGLVPTLWRDVPHSALYEKEIACLVVVAVFVCSSLKKKVLDAGGIDSRSVWRSKSIGTAFFCCVWCWRCCRQHCCCCNNAV